MAILCEEVISTMDSRADSRPGPAFVFLQAWKMAQMAITRVKINFSAAELDAAIGFILFCEIWAAKIGPGSVTNQIASYEMLFAPTEMR